jgi:hypothetical protein
MLRMVVYAPLFPRRSQRHPTPNPPAPKTSKKVDIASTAQRQVFDNK